MVNRLLYLPSNNNECSGLTVGNMACISFYADLHIQVFKSVLFHPKALSRLSSIHGADDEVHEVGYPSVNAWIAWFCAPMTQDKWAYETLA